jgi:hypothetical protein
MVFAPVCGAGCDDDEYGGDSYSYEYSSSGYAGYESSSCPGYLFVWTLPAGASVYVEGQYLGETAGYDDFIVEVKGGTYKIEIYRNGYELYLEYVLVYPGEIREVNVYLRQIGYDPYYPPLPIYDGWEWYDESDGDGPVYVAATRPIY